MKYYLVLLAFCFASVSAIVTPVQAQSCDQLVMRHVAAVNASQADLETDPQNALKINAFQDAEAALNDDLGFERGTACLVGLILKTQGDNLAKQDFTQIASQVKAAFQQNGSSTGTGGTTNLVSKGTTARVLSLAAEYGALTESTSGSTVTLQGTLAGIPTALETNSILPPCGSAVEEPGCISNGFLNALNRVSYSIGFNTSQNSQSLTGTATSSTLSAQPANFTVNSQTLNSITVKGAVIQAPVANSAAVSSAITKLTSTSSSVVADKTLQVARIKLTRACQNALTQKLPGKEVTWPKDAWNILLASPTSDSTAFSKAWYALGPDLIAALERDPKCKGQYVSDSRSVASALNAYLVSLNTFFEGLRGTPVLSLEYDYNTPAGQPSNSTIRLVGQLSKKGLTGTLNAASSFYNSTPSSAIPGASRVRDFQVAAEGSYDFGKGKTPNPIFGNSTASLAYYYQDQTSPAILNVTPGQPVSGITFTGLPSTATQVYAKKGVINIGQAKFTLNPANSGFTFPVSVTWSNRTELVTKPTWRGQIGISYDLDSLFSKLK
jgi:hypothetical protein